MKRDGPGQRARRPRQVYGTRAVWTGWAIPCAVVATVVRPEERRLAARVGDACRACLAAVPRWVGRTPRRVSPGRGR